MANRLLQAGALTCASYLMMIFSQSPVYQSPVHPIHLSLEQPPNIVQIGSRLGDYLGILIDRTGFN